MTRISGWDKGVARVRESGLGQMLGVFLFTKQNTSHV